MKKLLFSFLSPFSPWLAFQTVLVLHQSFMLVCMPSQPCRWWPVQPVESKSSLCVFIVMYVCVFVPCLRECLFVERELTSYETQSKLRDRVVYKCYIIINFSEFVGFCFERVTGHWLDSHSASWKSTKSLFKCLPADPSKLWLSASQCAQNIKHKTQW